MTGSLLESQVYANYLPEIEQDCLPRANNNGGKCISVPKKKSAIKKNLFPASIATASTKINTTTLGSKSSKATNTADYASQKNSLTTPIPQPLTPIPLRTTLNWTPVSNLTPTQRASQPSFTCGAYIEPERPGKYFKGDANTQRIVAEADKSNYDENNVATMEGNVLVLQANKQFEADKVTFNKQNNYAQFEGKVRIREPDILIIGERGDAQLNTGKARVENATYVIYHSKLRGHASTVVRNEDKTMDLTNATYTSCPPGDNGWLLSGKDLHIDSAAGFGIARNTVIEFLGLPILYTPYIRFPIDNRRQSGFLYPTFTLDLDNGSDISIPYYMNLAPNYDATITPRLIANRGELLESEARYLTKKNKGELMVAGTAGKDKLKLENPYQNTERWIVSWLHKTQLTTNWDIEIDYTDASDKGYLHDFVSSPSLSHATSVNQKVSTNYTGGNERNNWQLRILALKYKNMSWFSNDPYNKLPQFELKGSLLANDNLTVNYIADYTQFSRNENWRFLHEEIDKSFDPADKITRSIYEQGFGINRAEGERVYLETGVSLPLKWSYAFLTPTVKIRHVQYRLKSLVKNEVVTDLNNAYGSFSSSDYTKSPRTTVPLFALDGGLYFDRQTFISSTKYTHTFEPRMKYLYAPSAKGQEMNPIFDTSEMGFSYASLWRDNRFSGYDRLADSNHLALGFTTKLIDDDDSFERMRFSAGQIVHFKNREVYIDPTTGQKVYGDAANWDENLTLLQKQRLEKLNEPASLLATELTYNFNRVLNLKQNLTWDTNTNQLEHYGAYYHYHPEARKVINIGYSYQRQVDRLIKAKDGTNVLVDPKNPNQGYKMASNNASHSNLSFAWPISYHWSILGRWQYDLTNNRNIEDLSGIEYNSCCYHIRLLWRTWAETNDNIDHPNIKRALLLQFVLIGLGDFSGGSSTDYLNGIQGYTQREK
ncbi:MAG: LPS-assembly protein LptD [Candidatus Endonucleobacter bathymodioli]|uniref:LPS-assembly protein LptD n=1 Tax=Candidatus Endonucleibacter bathymodioli TaxID=539814 RepID=A0AA90NUN1_9GAMM|nr:LPS-assembly protein LptD [Candidatus Endonucleobacter bathymodioli]